MKKIIITVAITLIIGIAIGFVSGAFAAYKTLLLGIDECSQTVYTQVLGFYGEDRSYEEIVEYVAEDIPENMAAYEQEQELAEDE